MCKEFYIITNNYQQREFGWTNEKKIEARIIFFSRINQNY